MAPAPLLLLAPYGPGLWSAVLPRLATSLEVVVVPPGDEEDLTGMAVRVLRHAPPRFHVAGFCLGGHLAVELHRQAGERVCGIALLNTDPAPDSPGQRRIREERIARIRAKALDMGMPDQGYVEHAVRWLLSPASCRSEELFSRARRLLAESPVKRSLAQQLAMLNRPDARRYVIDKALPVLLVGARGDRVCPVSSMAEIAGEVVGARVRVLDDCGHLSPLEQPAGLANAINDWFCASPPGVGNAA